MLKNELRHSGILVEPVGEDIETLIEQTTILIATRDDSFDIVGEDVVILVLLTEFTNEYKTFSFSSLKKDELRKHYTSLIVSIVIIVQHFVSSCFHWFRHDIKLANHLFIDFSLNL